MYSDDKKTDLPDGPNQLGVKNDNPTMDESMKAANIAFTPGDPRPMVAQIFTKSGITSSPLPVPKQSAPIRFPLADKSDSLDTM
jgi:hypothetical protein